MKKELESGLRALAVQILNNDAATTTLELKKQAALLYEQLSVLAFAEAENAAIVKTTPVHDQTEAPKTEDEETPIIALERPPENVENQPETLFETAPAEDVIPLNEAPVDAHINKSTGAPDLLYELDELTAGFKNMPEFEPAAPITPSKKPTAANIDQPKDTLPGTTPPQKLNERMAQSKASLNERSTKSIQIGLNDRIAFTTQLFGNSQDDYTRVISQLNTMHTVQEAEQFIATMVKPEYGHWQGKEIMEERFKSIVFRKFEA